MEIFKGSLNYFWRAQTSQIYRELKTIEKNEWATLEVIKQSGKPDKKLYEITEKGQEELRSWLMDNQLSMGNNALLMKVFFFGELDPKMAIQFFEDYVESFRQSEEAINAIPSSNREDYMASESDHELFWDMTIEYGKRLMKANREWSEYCLEVLRKREEQKKA